MGKGRVVGAVVIAVVWATGSAGAAPPITKIEARSLPERVVIQRVLDQLSDILIPPEPWPKGHRPKRLLTDMYYSTKPHGTYVAGLCESDRVIFRFDPTGVHDEGASTPVKVSGLEVTRTFHFVAPPSVEIDSVEMSRIDSRALDRRCAELNSDEEFFMADDETLARDGVLLLRSALNQVTADSVPSSFNCEGASPRDCAQTLATLRLDELTSIRTCIGESDKNKLCTQIWGKEAALTVYSDNRGKNAKILRATIGELVTVSDPRED